MKNALHNLNLEAEHHSVVLMAKCHCYALLAFFFYQNAGEWHALDNTLHNEQDLCPCLTALCDQPMWLARIADQSWPG